MPLLFAVQRAIAPLGFLICSALVPVAAQEFHHYEATLTNLVTTAQEKQILRTLYTMDDLGEYRLERGTGEVVIKTCTFMDRTRLEYMISPFNVGVARFTEVGAVTRPVIRAPRAHRPADMPLYMDTGDPARDNLRYDAYKAAWIAVHPDEYRELTMPDSMTTSETD